MNQTVSLKEKKEFIQWFLKRYQMKRRESVWMLNYYLSHDEHLENLHFVEESHYCPRALVMSVTESTGIPFRFYSGSDMTASAEKAFTDIKSNSNTKMYIQLNFPNSISVEYLSVLEENPHTPKIVLANRNIEDIEIAEQLIEHVMKMSYQNNLSKMIDEALDNGDKELFMKLTSQMVNA
jgi:uncharacterized protein YpiB (UPF0302 family)